MSETMADYEDLINASFRSFREGDTVPCEGGVSHRRNAAGWWVCAG